MGPPHPRAWVAEGRLTLDGERCPSRRLPALVLFSVCVHEDFSTEVEDRLALLRDIVETFGRGVPAGVPSLWVLPGGYFGFIASAGRWLYLSPAIRRRTQESLLKLVRHFPRGATVALGADTRESPFVSQVMQQVWIVERGASEPLLSVVTRGRSTLSERNVQVGPLKAAFFVCGEFTGSRTEENGPFAVQASGERLFLSHPSEQLEDCRLLVDLAHLRVSGSVSGTPGPRMVHRRQMSRFSSHGAAVLTHHHAGARSGERAQFKHQSNWIVFRGGEWLDTESVVAI
jgi:hypothetical protein